MSAPPIREPWKTDKEGKLISLPWILWLQQMASVGSSDGVASSEAMLYNPSSSTAPSNDSEMLAWLSF